MRLSSQTIIAAAFLLATTAASTATTTQGNALFRYKQGDPVDRNSSLTASALAPSSSDTRTSSDVGQTPIDGSASYSTAVGEGALSSGAANCSGGQSVWTEEVQNTDSVIRVVPRARYIEFTANADGFQEGYLSGECQISCSTQSNSGLFLSVPFTLSTSSTVQALTMKLDRSQDQILRTGLMGSSIFNSTFSWALYSDLNGNGLFDAGEPVADNGQAQQSLTVGFLGQKDISGTYSGTLAGGKYVLACRYSDTVGAGLGLTSNVDSSWNLDQAVTARFRLELQ